MDDQDPERRKRFELILLAHLINKNMLKTASIFAREASIELPPTPINTPPAAQNKGKSTAGPGTQYNQPQVSQSGFNHKEPLPPFPLGAAASVVEIPKSLSQKEASSSAPRMFGSSSQFPADAYTNLRNSIRSTIWFGFPPLPINTTTPAAQNKGKSVVGSGTQYVQPQVSQSGFDHNNPLPLFPPGVHAYVQPLSQQEASSSAPRMIGSSSQFPVDAYPNLQDSTWSTFWSGTNSQLLELLLQKPYTLWSDSYLQLAAQRRMQLMLHLLSLMVNKVLKSGSMAMVSPLGAPMFEICDSDDFERLAGMNYTHFPFHVGPQFGADQICSRLGERVILSYLRDADTEQQPKKEGKSIGFETQDDQHQVSPFSLDHDWVGEVVPVDNIGNKLSRQLEVEFLFSSTVDGIVEYGHGYEECPESESQILVNALLNLPNPVSTIWRERDFQQVQSLMQTPYFMWNNTGFELALRKMWQLLLLLLQLKIEEVGQISPFPEQQAIPPNMRFPAPQRQREISPQHSSTNNGQDDGNNNSNTGEVDGSFELNKKDDTTED